MQLARRPTATARLLLTHVDLKAPLLRHCIIEFGAYRCRLVCEAPFLGPRSGQRGASSKRDLGVRGACVQGLDSTPRPFSREEPGSTLRASRPASAAICPFNPPSFTIPPNSHCTLAPRLARSTRHLSNHGHSALSGSVVWPAPPSLSSNRPTPSASLPPVRAPPCCTVPRRLSKLSCRSWNLHNESRLCCDTPRLSVGAHHLQVSEAGLPLHGVNDQPGWPRPIDAVATTTTTVASSALAHVKPCF